MLPCPSAASIGRRINVIPNQSLAISSTTKVPSIRRGLFPLRSSTNRSTSCIPANALDRRAIRLDLGPGELSAEVARERPSPCLRESPCTFHRRERRYRSRVPVRNHGHLDRCKPFQACEASSGNAGRSGNAAWCRSSRHQLSVPHPRLLARGDVAVDGKVRITIHVGRRRRQSPTSRILRKVASQFGHERFSFTS
jgi:hypothetical protein